MSTIKNFGIAGVGSDLQLGKKGGRIVYDTTNTLFKITGSDGTTVSRVQIADAVNNNEAVSLSQVNSLISSGTSSLTTEVNSIESSVGLNTDGTYTAPTGTNYLGSATTILGAIEALDTQVGTNTGDISTNTTNISTNTGNITALQTEVNAVETGAGLGTDGTYTADATSNYITGATSLFNADHLLDAQIKVNADNIATNTGNISTNTSNISALQTEVNAIETGAGLGTSGTYTAPTGTNYLGSATSLFNADTLLDTQIGTNASNISSNTTAIGTKVSKTGDTMSGNLVMNTGTHITLNDAPVNGTDATNKNYVDSAVAGLSWKDSAVAATTANVTIGGDTQDNGNNTYVIDGVTLSSGDRVLVRAQTSASENGIYTVSLAAGTGTAEVATFTRASDAATIGELAGSAILVEGGTTYALVAFTCTTPSSATLGTDPITFVQFNGASTVTAGTGLSKSGNTLNVNLGAGIAQLPTDDVGVDLYTTSGLFLTTDGSTSSTSASAQLAVLLDGTTLAVSSAGLKVADATIASITNAQTEIDTIETSVGLNTDGTYTAPTGTNYLGSATTILGAIEALDTQVGTNTGNISTNTGNISSLQTEVNAIETGAGLGTSGTYTADATSNYITGATSLFNADHLLDAQIKVNADNIATNTTNISTNTSSIGTLSNLTTTTKTDLVSAINEADVISKFFVISDTTLANGEYISVDNTTAGQITLTAKNTAGTGDVNLILAGQGNGDVVIAPNASSQGLIIGDANTSVTVSGGDSTTANAGDAIIKGGNGTSTYNSGNVVLEGGTGGAAEGIVEIKDSTGNLIAEFSAGVASATDYITEQNGIGGATIGTAGSSTDVNLTLAPKGAGLVVAPSGYDMSTGGTTAFATKGYVDNEVTNVVASNTDPLTLRASIAADSSTTTFTIGTMSNVSGKTYYVSRITLYVSTAFSGNSVDSVVVSDGTNTLAASTDSDATAAGTYIIDLPFAVSTAGGATITAEFENASATAVAPTAGDMIATVEYKVL